MRTRLKIAGDMKDLKAFKLLVATTAQQRRPKAWPMGAGVEITLEISLARPRSLPKRVVLPLKRPAADKLLGAAVAGLTGILFSDGSQVLRVMIIKTYCPSLTPSSVKIVIDTIPKCWPEVVSG
jgi:hypothetical protein